MQTAPLSRVRPPIRDVGAAPRWGSASRPTPVAAYRRPPERCRARVEFPGRMSLRDAGSADAPRPPLQHVTPPAHASPSTPVGSVSPRPWSGLPPRAGGTCPDGPGDNAAAISTACPVESHSTAAATAASADVHGSSAPGSATARMGEVVPPRRGQAQGEADAREGVAFKRPVAWAKTRRTRVGRQAPDSDGVGRSQAEEWPDATHRTATGLADRTPRPGCPVNVRFLGFGWSIKRPTRAG